MAASLFGFWFYFQMVETIARAITMTDYSKTQILRLIASSSRWVFSYYLPLNLQMNIEFKNSPNIRLSIGLGVEKLDLDPSILLFGFDSTKVTDLVFA